MSRLKDQSACIGKKYGRLTVTGLHRSHYGARSMWIAECTCECGEVRNVALNKLKAGHTKSCGCYKREVVSKKAKTHGDSETRLYKIWAGMKKRCLDPSSDAYNRYGGRGITVCNEWLEYEPFRDWALATGYSEELTIDRIKNNDGYSPGNCRWADAVTQSQNRRTRSDNTSGIPGVQLRRDRWQARITAKRKLIVLGTFDTFEEAVAARKQGELDYWD